MRGNPELIIYALLIAISLLAPLVSYAGVSLIYPSSSLTASVNQSPPITWETGADYVLASSNGFAASFDASNNDASFTLMVSGLSGGTIVIDKLLNAVASSGVSSFKVRVSAALSGSLSPTPTTLKLRFWTGTTAPTADDSEGVVGVLDLLGSVGEETIPMTGGRTIYVQLVCTFASGTAGSSSVSIQPTSIVLQ